MESNNCQRINVRRRTLCAGALSLLLPSHGAVSAQSLGSLADLPWVGQLSQPIAPPDGEVGRLMSLEVTFEPNGIINDTERGAWDAQMRAIFAYLMRAPVLAAPRGIWPALRGSAAVMVVDDYLRNPAKSPIAGGIYMAPWTRSQVNLAADGTPTHKRGSETSWLTLEINYLYPLDHANWMVDDKGSFGPLNFQGKFQGFPVVGEEILITRDGKLPFVAVSQERVLKAFIKKFGGEQKHVQAGMSEAQRAWETYNSPPEVAKRRARIDAELAAISDPSNRERQRRYLDMWDKEDGEKLRKKALPDLDNDKAYGQLRGVREAEQRLAAMSPQERARPAWMDGDPNQHQLRVPLMAEGQGAQVMAMDPNYFDPRKPRTTMRVARVRGVRRMVEEAREPDRGDPNRTITHRAQLTLLQQVDWRAFAQRFLQPL